MFLDWIRILSLTGLCLVWLPMSTGFGQTLSNQKSTEMKLVLRSQVPTSINSGRYHRLTREAVWAPENTAIIVCDVWDLHHCLNAVRRVEQFAPRLNEVLQKAREQGVTIIHSPSDCLPFYEKHPARLRAANTPKSKFRPQDIESWCSRIPAEERAVYPIDQSDGGEDDDPKEHADWVKKLEQMGRNPGTPWKRQTPLIEIDEDIDFISDRGDEVWNILQDRKIENVILTGVHTNMCVLGRPFGLRQMIRGGKNVVLMRDMTDSMYNPQRWPYVSHFSGNDLVIDHVERFVCPTITSDQLIGGKPFRFKKDKRPHIVIVMAENEYKTNQTLPRFAEKFLRKDFRISYVFADEKNRNDLPGLEIVDQAELLIISVRRRLLTKTQMDRLKKYVAAGKPVLGIRTASHAFSVKEAEVPEALVDWPEFDKQVFGGNYTGHESNRDKPLISWNTNQSSHPVLTGLRLAEFKSGGSLYKTSPLNDRANIVLTGWNKNRRSEPAAWTFKRADGGRSFYTSLGHVDDFDRRHFQRLLNNAVFWCLEKEVPETIDVKSGTIVDRWVTTAVPHRWDPSVHPELKGFKGKGWYRCLVRFGKNDRGKKRGLEIGHGIVADVWINGSQVPATHRGNATTRFDVPADSIEFGDLNLLVIRIDSSQQIKANLGLLSAPELLIGDRKIELKGNWQFRIGDDESYSKLALPPKFAASTDIIFD